MFSGRYIELLGRAREAFATADYEMVFFVATVDSAYWRLVDDPPDRSQLRTSGNFGNDLQLKTRKVSYLDAAFTSRIDALVARWNDLVERRNNLSHAWGYQDANGQDQLGGYCFKFSKGQVVSRQMMHWSEGDLSALIADCQTLFGDIRSLRLEFEALRLAQP